MTFPLWTHLIHFPFRYTGRTQKEIVEFVRENYVKRQSFQRFVLLLHPLGYNMMIDCHRALTDRSPSDIPALTTPAASARVCLFIPSCLLVTTLLVNVLTRPILRQSKLQFFFFLFYLNSCKWYRVSWIVSRHFRLASQEHIDTGKDRNGRCSPLTGTSVSEWTSGRWRRKGDGSGITRHFQQLSIVFQPAASALSVSSTAAADAIRSLPLIASDGGFIFFSAAVTLSRSDPKSMF